ncbi:MAG: HAD-IA family hydrolase [Alphaproteobacteria bacterium]|nr:HAD-IA family hydrolase [Alphaproteobacteria bacterium]
MSNVALPDVVLWDWDGTLMDSYSFLNNAHNETLTSLGFEPLKEGEYKQYFGMPREVLYPAIYKDKHEEAKKVFVDYVTRNADKAIPVQGAENALKFFKAHYIPMGVVSNKKAELVALEKKHVGWDSYFDILVGAGEASGDKPEPYSILFALDKMGVNPNKKVVWYIGDTENDLAAAQKAGCKSVFLTDYENTQALIEKYKPLLTFNNYEALMEILVAISSHSSKNDAAR